jgi:hypothetical protein
VTSISDRGVYKSSSGARNPPLGQAVTFHPHLIQRQDVTSRAHSTPWRDGRTAGCCQVKLSKDRALSSWVSSGYRALENP